MQFDQQLASRSRIGGNTKQTILKLELTFIETHVSALGLDERCKVLSEKEKNTKLEKHFIEALRDAMRSVPEPPLRRRRGAHRAAFHVRLGVGA